MSAETWIIQSSYLHNFWDKNPTPFQIGTNAKELSHVLICAITQLTQWSRGVRPLLVGTKTAARVSISTFIYSVCFWRLCLPLQCVCLNTVSCLKETQLMANDIWKRPSVIVMWYCLRAAEACLRDVAWLWIHTQKQETNQKTGHCTKSLTLN